jgi:hypothetical protein
MSKKGLGISKFEILLMLPGLRKQLKRAIDKKGTVDMEEAMTSMAWFVNKLSRAARKQYRKRFEAMARSFTATGSLIKQRGEGMKFELGITVGEITAMLPELLAAAWAHYSDDKKISLDEGVDLVATVMDSMADAADDENVSEFFFAQASALRALAPFFEEEEEPEPEEPA